MNNERLYILVAMSGTDTALMEVDGEPWGFHDLDEALRQCAEDERLVRALAAPFPIVGRDALLRFAENLRVEGRSRILLDDRETDLAAWIDALLSGP